ncbi:MAG: NAD-dependent epimerase/dehydratase family protein [Mycobacterium sp.]
MKILLTGATGFIGHHLVERLLRDDHDVLVATTTPDHVPPDWRVTTVVFQDSAGGLDESEIRRFGPDALVHLGWAGIPDLGVTWSLTNVAMSARVVATALGCGVQRVVGVGSCREYATGGGAKTEADAPAEDADIFAQAKVCTHQLIRAASEGSGAEWRWARPFFVYGPGQRSDSLIPAAVAKAAAGSELTVASPSAAVDFVNVVDVAEALYLLATRPGPSGAFNIGSGRAHNVASVAGWVAREWRGQQAGEILSGSEPDAWWADTTAIRNSYGWSSTVMLESGIRNVIAGARG